jgi:hypothetical protein
VLYSRRLSSSTEDELWLCILEKWDDDHYHVSESAEEMFKTAEDTENYIRQRGYVFPVHESPTGRLDSFEDTEIIAFVRQQYMQKSY